VEEHDLAAKVCEADGLLLDPLGDFDLGRRDRLDARERRRHAVVLALAEQKLGRLRVETRRGHGDGARAQLLYNLEGLGASVGLDERAGEERARRVDGRVALLRVEALIARELERRR